MSELTYSDINIEAIYDFCRKVKKLMNSHKDMSIRTKEHLINHMLEDLRYEVWETAIRHRDHRKASKLKSAPVFCEIIQEPLKPGVLTLVRKLYLKFPDWVNGLLIKTGKDKEMCLYREHRNEERVETEVEPD